jgi:hypothetical protein
MTPTEVAAILGQRVYHLQLAREDAATRGDLDRVSALDADILATQGTIGMLAPSVADED